MNDDVFKPALKPGEERLSSRATNTQGFHLKPPPAAHELEDFITSDAKLFETIHMGPVEVDESQWRLQVDGLVSRPFSIDLQGLKSLPARDLVAFHECFGSPLKPGTHNLLRIGNVKWTGVPLATLLERAGVRVQATHIWSDGLDSGTFAGKTMDRYRKDLPVEKALSADVLVAYAMNDLPLTRERGGPVRLIVPGWFGTNMTKWLCRISAQDSRASDPWTTAWYNRPIDAPQDETTPVYEVEPNSMITSPADGSEVAEVVTVVGWAWAEQPIAFVELSTDEGKTWSPAKVTPRKQFEWQAFEGQITCVGLPREFSIIVRSTDARGNSQPLANSRSAAHSVGVRRAQIC
jgi:DMSO/TMAO reductase YedYZ molybdopterin-dependent catalytic subunit